MNNVRMSIDVPKDLHKIIKVHALLQSQSIKEYVIKAISKQINADNSNLVLNKKTTQILEESDSGLNLNKYNNLEDLYTKLGL